MTRLAESPWSVWSDILEDNADAIEVPLGELIDELVRIRETLAQRDSPALAPLFTK